MKSVYAIFGVAILMLFLGGIMAALNTFRGVDVTEPHNVALVGADNTTATLVLANDVMDANKVNVTVFSPNLNDAPVAFDYVSATRRLTVSGLAPDTTRQISIVYKVSRLDSIVDLMARFFPAFFILALIAIVVGAAVATWQGSRGG